MNFQPNDDYSPGPDESEIHSQAIGDATPNETPAPKRKRTTKPKASAKRGPSQSPLSAREGDDAAEQAFTNGGRNQFDANLVLGPYADVYASWSRTLAGAKPGAQRKIFEGAVAEMARLVNPPPSKRGKCVALSPDNAWLALCTLYSDHIASDVLGAGEAERISENAIEAALARESSKNGTLQPLKSVLQAANPTEFQAEIARLAQLHKSGYSQERKPAAKKLGLGVGEVDALVKEERRAVASTADELPHWKVEPWADPVDGAALLDEIAGFFSRHVVLPKHGATALALWALHAWTFDVGDISPFLVVKSPEKRCGKTTTMIILQFVTPRSELASNISPSAVFRYIEQCRPTLLIDEADTFANDNDELRGIINGAHTKASAYVIRNVEIGGEHQAKRFSTWAPKAIAAIGGLADTLEDRSITLTLQRKAPGQTVERLRRRDGSGFQQVRRKALRWANDNGDTLATADDRTEVPQALNDRAADNWRPLLGIADLAGGKWPDKAREAALAMSGEQSPDTERVRLLADIREAFGDTEGIFTKTLIERLIADPEKAWADYRNGKPMGPKHIGALLKHFGIISETVSPAEAGVTDPEAKDAKGYKRVRFEDAWASYLSPQKPTSTPSSGFDPSKRRSDCGTETSAAFSKRREGESRRIEKHEEVAAAQRLRRVDGSKGGNGGGNNISDASAAPVCVHCECKGNDRAPVREASIGGEGILIHDYCQKPYMAALPPHQPHGSEIKQVARKKYRDPATMTPFEVVAALQSLGPPDRDDEEARAYRAALLKRYGELMRPSSLGRVP
jgi:hypothetical protein